eukprot:5955456-Pleurochrysis_carterae.AAC.6
MDTDLNHARLKWRIKANLILYRVLPRVTTILAGEKVIISTDTNSHWQGSGRRRGGWAHLRSGSGKRQQAAAAIASRGTKELGERSASTPRVHMRCKSKIGNCACECQIAVRGARDNSCK